jgi:anti-anti-sigma factor
VSDTSTPAPLSVACDFDGGDALLTVCGEIDTSSASALLQALDDAVAAGSRNVVVDMSAVTFIDSSGLTTLIHGYKATRRGQGWLSIREPSAVVTRLLTLTGQLERFTTA